MKNCCSGWTDNETFETEDRCLGVLDERDMEKS